MAPLLPLNGKREPPSQEEYRAFIERICASARFQRAHRLRELLIYLASRGWAGDHSALKEAAVGQAVYERLPGYNTNDDNVVRMGVSQLRRKLRQYFEEEGAGELLRLQIPKGSYVPRVEWVATDGSTAASPPEAAQHHPVRRRAWPGSVAMLLALCSGIWGTLVVAARHPGAVAAEQHDRFSNFWQEAIGDGNSTMFVSEDFEYLAAGDGGRQPTLQAYVERRGTSNLENFAPVQSTTQLSLRVSTRLMASQPARFSRVSFTSSRDVKVQDFKERNVILVGSPRAAPWLGLFEDSLNFHYEFDESRHQSRFRNRQPKPGELSLYTPLLSDNKHGMVYSVVALLPNLGYTGKVLILMGTRSQGTEAATEAVSHPDTLESILKSVERPGSKHLPYFEVLLESQLVDGVNLPPRVVASRIYEQAFELTRSYFPPEALSPAQP